MIKNILLTFLMLSVVGCSFSKKSAEEKAKDAAEAKSRASVDQVLEDKRYSLRAKIENAIINKDKQLFTSLMTNATSKELNQMKDGKSLAEFAVDTKDLFFVEGLFKTGMSPFIGADYFADGLVEYARAKNFEEGRRYIIHMRSNILRQASKVCVISSFQELAAFLEENSISPVMDVCGTMNLFRYYFSYIDSGPNSVDQILLKYVDINRADYGSIGQALLVAAFDSRSSELWKKIVNLVTLNQVLLFGRGFEYHIEYSSLESALTGYIFIRDKTPSELLKHINFYIRSRIKAADSDEVASLNSLLEESGLGSGQGAEDELPFKDRDCSKPAPKPYVFQRTDEEVDETPPPPGEGMYDAKPQRGNPRACN